MPMLSFSEQKSGKQTLCDNEGVSMANYKEYSSYPSGAAWSGLAGAAVGAGAGADAGAGAGAGAGALAGAGAGSEGLKQF